MKLLKMENVTGFSSEDFTIYKSYLYFVGSMGSCEYLQKLHGGRIYKKRDGCEYHEWKISLTKIDL